MSSCWYPIIKLHAIKTYFNTKWIPAGRQEKGERCFPWLAMFRLRYSEMLFPPCTENIPLGCLSTTFTCCLCSCNLSTHPSAQTLVKLHPCWWPLPGPRLWENKAVFFYPPKKLNASQGCLKDLFPPWCLCPFGQPHRAWTARVCSNHQAPGVGKFGAPASALWIAFKISLFLDHSFGALTCNWYFSSVFPWVHLRGQVAQSVWTKWLAQVTNST